MAGKKSAPKRGFSTGGTKQVDVSTWEEKRYPRGASRIQSTRTSKGGPKGATTETSTFTKGHSGKTTRTDVATKDGKRTFYQRTNDY